MSDLQSFETVLEKAQSMKNEDVNPPKIPMDVFIQEGMELHLWALQDIDKLEAVGLDRQWVEGLPVLTGALRHCEGAWIAERFRSQEARKLWKLLSPEAYDLRNTLVHTDYFAFRNNPEALRSVDQIAEGRSNADMIQDLSKLAALGRSYADLLAAIKFDMALLDRAAALAEELSAIYAESRTDRLAYSEAKKTRDKIATLLKKSVDEVRACGQYLFWRNEERRRGYTSEYIRKINNASTQVAETPTETETVTEPTKD